MLRTVVIVLLALWVLGLASAQTMGGLIHLLLVVALIMVAFRFLRGKRVV